ncbi:hypothetical protein D3C83_38710 [compost metagenome]
MRGLKWWLWIVGVLYVLEGGGLTLLRIFDPTGAAAIWTASGEAGQLDTLAMQAVLVPSLFVTLSWLVLGLLMLWFARAPARCARAAARRRANDAARALDRLLGDRNAARPIWSAGPRFPSMRGSSS